MGIVSLSVKDPELQKRIDEVLIEQCSKYAWILALCCVILVPISVYQWS